MRISYSEFAGWLQPPNQGPTKPFVYINTSCWGNEKSWFNLGFLPPSRLIEVAAMTPANFFYDHGPNAIKVILDGLRNGRSFSRLRADLMELTEYRMGIADRYVLPDEQDYQHGSALVKIQRSLTVEKNGHIRKYSPNGYI